MNLLIDDGAYSELKAAVKRLVRDLEKEEKRCPCGNRWDNHDEKCIVLGIRRIIRKHDRARQNDILRGS